MGLEVYHYLLLSTYFHRAGLEISFESTLLLDALGKLCCSHRHPAANAPFSAAYIPEEYAAWLDQRDDFADQISHQRQSRLLQCPSHFGASQIQHFAEVGRQP